MDKTQPLLYKTKGVSIVFCFFMIFNFQFLVLKDSLMIKEIKAHTIFQQKKICLLCIVLLSLTRSSFAEQDQNFLFFFFKKLVYTIITNLNKFCNKQTNFVHEIHMVVHTVFTIYTYKVKDYFVLFSSGFSLSISV